MNNTGGLNVTSSPLAMEDNQATGQSYNYDYARTGAISKVLGPTLINSTPDAQLKSIGLGVHHDALTDARTLVRAAGTKVQVVNITTGVITDQSDDTATVGGDFFQPGTTQPVVFTPFNTQIGGTILWMAGGGLTSLIGFTGTEVTSNGVPAPTGSMTAVVSAGAGDFTPGTYWYGLQFRKTSTQSYSNVSLDVSAVIVNPTDIVTLAWTLSNLDTTRFDQIRVWRSALNGVESFTTGSVIAELAISATGYIDTGTSIVDSQNTPRSGNTILDDSVLPTGEIKSVTTFKRRLITAIDSTFYLSDLDKPESWPLTNKITIPTGGPITALGVIGVPSEYTTGADEYLCIWKESELWVMTGTGPADWELKKVDKTGCAGQSLVVSFNGFITWLTYNGIFIWNGHARPSRISRPIQALFDVDGDIDKALINQGYSAQFEKSNEVIWRISHRTKGPNRVSIKMDTRLTSLAASNSLQESEMDGVFITDTDANSYYAIASMRPVNYDEILLSGDDAGYIYQLYSSATDAVLFDYETKPFDMGHPEILKRFKRVIVYVEKLSNNDLTLYYWADYRIRDEDRSKVQVSLTPSRGISASLWDVALWDVALWDDFATDIGPIEFNLHSNENNTDGVSLKLRFEQFDAAPVRIHGFEIEWEPIGNLPIPTQQAV